MSGDGGAHEIVVIGGGLAGLTAGLFAARYGHAVLVLEASVPGGHVVNVETIEDFPGFPEGVAGFDLGPRVQEQAERYGAQFALAEVDALEPEDPDASGASNVTDAGTGESGPPSRRWRVITGQGVYRAPAVIVASGSRLRPLGVSGEERLYGRGVSHCATCDGPFFRGRTVALAGGGDIALQEALTLAGYAERVIVLHPGDTATGQQTYLGRVAEQPKIEVRHHTVVTEVLGDLAVEGVRVRDTAAGAECTVECAALFVYAGFEPHTTFLRDQLRLAEDGRIPVDAQLRTALAGVFAAGDVRQGALGHALTAAADGATAAIGAHRYLLDRHPNL